MTVTYASVDELLRSARGGLDRISPRDAHARVAAGAIIVDIRPAWQRELDGEIPGSVVVERNHLEWRLHPRSGANLGVATEGQEWIVVCTEGYTSSLAAAALVSLGLPARDIVGGIHAWRAEGLPVVAGPTPVEHRVPEPS
ncbi:rhodanese-like domain-containing protein [Aeromicrobium fastidiosum]|uniref:rhodanese-like domain-containing protein n=1 Tax=Aeromicrobium fastidiosum TaxID=52699 RepID=UPI0020236084|nr:rhodanese-like domain-containing protein [Aeromicrobium fastidiosum]MCL8251539.1 rhodanese-like domain-containing protein [Aeromicrobium fastidiosum]